MRLPFDSAESPRRDGGDLLAACRRIKVLDALIAEFNFRTSALQRAISCRRKSRADQVPARITVQHYLPIENNATNLVLHPQHRHVIDGIAIDDDEVGVLAFI